jgi:HEAT repeat protein
MMTARLQIKDVRTRESAIDYIASMVILPEAQPAIPAIAQMLRESAGFNVRQRAIMAFGNKGACARPALPALFKLPKDKDAEWILRTHAAASLGKTGSAARIAVPALQQASRSDDYDIRRVANLALHKIN